MNNNRTFELMQKGASNLAIDELVELVEDLNKPTEIPPCRVCGADLEIGSAGGGQPTSWACSSPEADFIKNGGGFQSESFKHYADSKFEDRRHTDPWAYELAKRVKNG